MTSREQQFRFSALAIILLLFLVVGLTVMLLEATSFNKQTYGVTEEFLLNCSRLFY